MRKITYLQGLRGTAALWVVLHHFFCAFYPMAVFATGPSHWQWEKLFWSTPLGLLIAGRSLICLFFILSGYVLSLPYFGAGAKDLAQLCAAMVKRPFRLVGLVALTMIASVMLLNGHFYHNAQVAEISGSEWLGAQSSTPVGYWHFLVDLISNPFWNGENYNQPLWTIFYELVGSYLTFIFTLLFRNSQVRWWAYAIVGLTFSGSLYGSFILGIFLADLSKNFPGAIAKANQPWFLLPLLGAGIYLAAYPIFINQSQLPSTWFSHLPWSQFNDRYSMAGAFFLFCAVLAAPLLQRLFSIASVVYLGRISFALYAVHLLVLRSFSSWLFLKLNPYYSYNQSFVYVLVCSVFVIIVCAHLLTVYFDEILIQLSDRIASLWLARTQSKTM